VSNLGYSYNTDSSPFGSAYQSGLSQYVRSNSSLFQDENNPTTWDSRPTEIENQPLYVEAFNPLGNATLNPGPNIRAGTPYACTGDCNGSVCVGGTRDGNLCIDDDSAENCYSGDGLNVGVCVGSWQAAANGRTQAQAVTSLSDLTNGIFVRSLGIYNWQLLDGRWQYVRAAGNGWDNITDTSWISPVIGNVLVDDQATTLTLAGGGTVKLSFTTNIANDQLPLRSYVIDWGDTSPDTTVQGYFNERPSPGDPHILYHSYSGDLGTYDITIRVMDNWGFGDNPQRQAIYTFINAVNITDGGSGGSLGGAEIN
jgi:hypothetical protein